MPAIDAFLEPIPGDDPTGVDVSYDVVYDEIREARESDDPNLAQGEWKRDLRVADFRRVAKLAGDVLTKQSKDLQVAAWLLEAWIDQHGFEGLRDGLELQRRLMEQFWEDVHPRIDDGDLDFRAKPLRWIGGGYLDLRIMAVPLTPAGHDWATYLQAKELKYEEAAKKEGEDFLKARAKAIEGGAVPPEEIDAAVDKAPKAWYKGLVSQLEAVIAALDSLETSTETLFEALPVDARPGFRRLRKTVGDIERLAGDFLKKKLKQDPDPVDAPEVNDPEVVSEAAPGGDGTVPLEPTSRTDADRRIAAAARFLRQADPLDPSSYLMIRGLRWGELRKQGGELDPRLLAAPPTPTRTHLKGLLLDGKWAQLLEAAEDVMATPYGRGWLDLQRYVFTALDGLGSQYDPVEASLRGALRALLVDIPSLPDLTLMDDTPTANRETRRWLAEEGLLGPLTEEEQARLEAPAAASMPTGRDVSDRARERVRAGQPQKAIELLMRAADEAGSPRGRFLRRSEAAGIMVDHGLAQVALPILNDVMARIETHKLEEWEDPETVALPMAFLYRCLDATGGDESKKDDLYQRVCRLDPMQAIHFSASDSKTNDGEAADGGEDGGAAGG